MTPEEAKVDVLIIGAGPAGLMLATWLARLGIKTRIVDKRFDRINSGQADGLQSRTFEIFDSLGFGQDVWRQANHMLEIRFWNPDQEGQLYRSDAIIDTKAGLSRFQQATLHQGCIEDYIFKYIQKHSDITVERGLMPESLTIDAAQAESDDAYPVSVTLRQLPKPAEEAPAANGNGNKIPNGLYRSNLAADPNAALLQSAQDASTQTETIRAKYVVGCDGAHSWTRRLIGSVMEGEQTDFVWGVLDIVPITDFPDIRYRCAIHSAAGSMMIIPREDKLVRLYIQVTEVDEQGNAIDRFKVSPESLLEAANRILSPYKLSYKHCHWYTAYRIGQRCASRFAAHDRVFLAGDAVHTHSPKAGQGMNISMHDAYNLGWKLAHVVRGLAPRSLLSTYTSERRQIAQELIAFDTRFSRLFSGRPAKDLLDSEGIDLSTFKKVFDKGNLFASGCAVDYAASAVVAKPASPSAAAAPFASKQHLAPHIPLGMRIPSHKVLNQSDARPWHLQELLPSTGAYRLVVFAGALANAAQLARYTALGGRLASSKVVSGPRLPDGSPLVELLTVHSSPRRQIELSALPEAFRPFSEEFGWDYNKIFVDDESYHEGHGEAYKNYGIDAERGCLVLVRPDQYVSWIGELEDVEGLEEFLRGVVVVA